MQRIGSASKLFFFSALLLAAVLACVSFPEEYVAPDKVVFLRQPFYLVPVRYAPESADPYTWRVDPEINQVNPGILTPQDFNVCLKPDLSFDAKTYKETKEHLLLMKDDAVFIALKDRLNAMKVDKPLPRAIAKGDEVKKYTNGTEYAYPEEAGSTIMFFDNRDVKITFADGRTYFGKAGGDFFEKDAAGTERYAFFAQDGSFRTTIGKDLYAESPDWRSLKTDAGGIVKTNVPLPQYDFTPAGKTFKYLFFVGDFANEKLVDIALVHANSLRYDFLPGDSIAMVSYQEKETVVINDKFVKSHHRFNIKTRKAEELYSYYFPEGIRIVDVQKRVTYAEVAPRWPEQYLERKIGPFRILYVKKDEPLLDRLNAKKLTAASVAVSNATGIAFNANRVIVLPPDLTSFRKLHAQAERETLLWYPSGFQGKDIIVMWPPSLPRYEGDQGDRYFWETELYEILTHELTHLAVGEITGVFPPVPVWLNEGLAVYVESRSAGEVKKYWDVTFAACLAQGKRVDWDAAAVNATSEFGVDVARTDYAQSYKMVEYLIGKFGMRSLSAYLVSFKLPFEKIQAADLNSSYKDNFTRIFKTKWEENLAAFEQYCKTGKR